MTTMTTLFGGLVAVAVLYALGGTLKALPPLLRAALAGLIPLLAYFVLIAGRWPGLDVAAMHVSVFLAAALVLHAFSQFRRRSAGRLHWAPRLLIVFFLGLVVVNGTLLYIATKGLPEPVARWWLGSDGGAVYSGFSGVVTHGQNAAKAVSSELSQAHRSARLGWQVDVDGLDGTTAERVVRLQVRDRTGLPIDGLRATLRLARPGADRDTLVLPLAAHEPGVYGGVLALPESGRWVALLELARGDETYEATRELVAP